MSDLLSRFGDNLRKVRMAKGVSQEALADAADLHRTYVSSVERGKRNLTLESIAKLAKALGVSMAKLMPD